MKNLTLSYVPVTSMTLKENHFYYFILYPPSVSSACIGKHKCFYFLSICMQGIAYCMYFCT